MLHVKIYDDNYFPTDKVIWEIEYSGKKADKEYKALKALSADPMLQGEMISLRFNDGEGGGFAGNGVMYETTFEHKDNKTVANVFLSLDKWRSW